MNIATDSINENLKYWLVLSRVQGVGTRTFLNLLEQHSPEQLYAESTAALSALGLKSAIIQAIKNPDWASIAYDLEWLALENNGVITFNDANYPSQLKEISDPPPILFIRGNPELLALPQIAIVGSRNPSSIGVETAFDFAKQLSQFGFVITSGLALGIDGASHRGALTVGRGRSPKFEFMGWKFLGSDSTRCAIRPLIMVAGAGDGAGLFCRLQAA